MTDERLIDDQSLGEFGQALLQAGREASPPRGSSEKLLLALGAATTAKVTAGAAVAASSKPALFAQKLLALKWALVGAGGLVAVTSGYIVMRPPEAPQTPAVVADGKSGDEKPAQPQPGAAPVESGSESDEPSSDSAEASGASAAEQAPPTAPAREASSPRRAGPPTERPTSRVKVPQAKLPAADSEPIAETAEPQQPPADTAPAVIDARQLAEEVRLLDRVRRAVQRGDSAGAKQGLATYDARFPSGTLRPEAAKLRQSARNLSD